MLSAVYAYIVCLLVHCSEHSAPHLEAVEPPSFTVEYIQQYLDHFNYAVKYSWREKYIVTGTVLYSIIL